MYAPLPPFLFIKPFPSTNSPHGYGLFTKTNLRKNCPLGVSHVYHDWFDDGWISTPLGGFYNHSYEPNCELRPSTMEAGFLTAIKVLYTIKDIAVGQELTCIDDFSLINDVNDPQHSTTIIVDSDNITTNSSTLLTTMNYFSTD